MLLAFCQKLNNSSDKVLSSVGQKLFLQIASSRMKMFHTLLTMKSFQAQHKELKVKDPFILEESKEKEALTLISSF